VSFFRTLQAAVDPRIETYTTTGHTVQNAPAEHEAPAPDQQHLFAAMAYFAEHPGVPSTADPALTALVQD